MESWKEEFDRKYDEACVPGNIEKIDAANDVVLEAIQKLDEIIKG